MSGLVLLFLCVLLGMGFRRSSAFPKETATVLNQFLIYISLPAMTLYYLPKIQFSFDLLFPLGVSWIGFLGSFLLFTILGKKFGWSKSLIGCLIITAGFGNTSFVGIPVIEALYGDKGMETLIIVDQPGTFVLVSTLGVIIASVYSKGSPDLKRISKTIFSFPPFLAFCLGSVMVIFQLQFPIILDTVFEKLTGTVTPLALVSVGYQLRFQKESKHWKFLYLGIMYQLVIWPLMIYILYIFILGQPTSSTVMQVCILEAAMPTMITAAIISSSFGLKPSLSNMMVGISIPISAITITIWYLILNYC